MQKNFYEILEVSNSASQESINAVYRALHDKYSSSDGEPRPDAAEQVKFLRIAHGILSNPAKRALYDERLAKASAAQAMVAEPPTDSQSRLPAAEAAAPATDNTTLVTPVELIAQLKKANRNLAPREDMIERLTSVATTPLVAAIIGLVFVGGMTYRWMQPAQGSGTTAAAPIQAAPDPLAAIAVDAAQKLGMAVEAGVGYKDYAARVASLASQVQAYQDSPDASKNRRLGEALDKLMEVHFKAKDIWAIKAENPELFSNVEVSNYHYLKVIGIYPPAAQMSKSLDERGQRVRLDIDDVLAAVWQEARRYHNDAKRLNRATT